MVNNNKKSCAENRKYDCNLYNSANRNFGTYEFEMTDNVLAGWGTRDTCLYNGNITLIFL